MSLNEKFIFKKLEKEYCEIFLKVRIDSIFTDNNLPFSGQKIQEFINGLSNPEDPVAFDGDFLLLQLKSWIGAVGIEGEINLVLAPVDKDIMDSWDFNRLAGRWDVWSFLNFQYVLNPSCEISININYLNGNFFQFDPLSYHVIVIGKLYEKDQDEQTDELIDSLCSNPTLIEYPKDRTVDFDFSRYELNLATQNFIDLLRTKWTFEVIPNPITNN